MTQIPLNDPTFVKEQYRDGANLDARIALHARFSAATRALPEWIFDQIDLPTDARLLEVGCGTGQLWTKNRSCIPASWRLTLTDFSFGMAETARAAGVAANFAQCDAQAIPFRDMSFDAVIANHMLYHVPDLSRALAGIRRVIKPGGKFYAATNGRDHMRELDEFTEEFGVSVRQSFARAVETTATRAQSRSSATAMQNLDGHPFGVVPASASLQFTLENGEEILSTYFSSVRRIDFVDALVVTEVEPLMAYILSMSSANEVRGRAAEKRLRQVISGRIARNGAFRITKASGLFIARAD